QSAPQPESRSTPATADPALRGWLRHGHSPRRSSTGGGADTTTAEAWPALWRCPPGDPHVQSTEYPANVAQVMISPRLSIVTSISLIAIGCASGPRTEREWCRSETDARTVIVFWDRSLSATHSPSKAVFADSLQRVV